MNVGRLTFVMLSLDARPLSLAALRAGGWIPVSEPTARSSAADAAPVLPAMSVAVAVMWCRPVPRAPALIEYAPPVAGPLPIGSPSENSDTVVPVSAEPLKIAPNEADDGWFVFGALGAPGAVVSTVTISGPDAGEAAPLSEFAATTVTACDPSAIAAGTLTANVPSASALPVPFTEPSTLTVTFAFATVVPVIVGAATFVMLSALLAPVSSEASRCGASGVAGGSIPGGVAPAASSPSTMNWSVNSDRPPPVIDTKFRASGLPTTLCGVTLSPMKPIGGALIVVSHCRNPPKTGLPRAASKAHGAAPQPVYVVFGARPLPTARMRPNVIRPFRLAASTARTMLKLAPLGSERLVFAFQ